MRADFRQSFASQRALSVLLWSAMASKGAVRRTELTWADPAVSYYRCEGTGTMISTEQLRTLTKEPPMPDPTLTPEQLDEIAALPCCQPRGDRCYYLLSPEQFVALVAKARRAIELELPVQSINALDAELDAARARYDALHDQRFAEARAYDDLRARHTRLIEAVALDHPVRVGHLTSTGNRCEICALLLAEGAKVTDQEKLAKLTAFARGVMKDWPDYNGIDGWDLQDLAVANGLLVATYPSEPCTEDCNCTEGWFSNDFASGKVLCYRPTDLLAEEPK